jgi:hypothetical protein
VTFTPEAEQVINRMQLGQHDSASSGDLKPMQFNVYRAGCLGRPVPLPRSRGYEEAGEGTCQCDRAGADESDVIARHRVQADARRER